MSEHVPSQPLTDDELAACEHPIPARLRELANRYGSCFTRVEAWDWLDDLRMVVEEVEANLRKPVPHDTWEYEP